MYTMYIATGHSNLNFELVAEPECLHDQHSFLERIHDWLFPGVTFP